MVHDAVLDGCFVRLSGWLSQAISWKFKVNEATVLPSLQREEINDEH